MVIKRQDYEEPRCLLDMDRSAEKPLYTVPVERVIGKLDEYFYSGDFDAAERHLKYWLEEAKQGRDKRAELTIRNEMMGFYRQRGKKDEAYEAASEGMRLTGLLGMEGSLSSATTCLNCATVFKAFGEPERAVEYYEKARELYEAFLPAGDKKLAGLYNNLALALTDLGRYDEAAAFYESAIKIDLALGGGEPDAAISCLNLADLYAEQLGAIESEEPVTACLENAASLLDRVRDRSDGYYSYVCEKCACVYAHYGWFMYEKELRERVKKIHDGT